MCTVKEDVVLEREASDLMQINEDHMIKKADPLMNAAGPPVPASSPLSQANVRCSPSSIPVMNAAVPLALPPSPGMNAAAQQLPLPPPLSLLDTPRLRRRKPCHGWVTDDDEEPRFIRLPSSLDGSISPPVTPPSQHAKHNFF